MVGKLKNMIFKKRVGDTSLALFLLIFILPIQVYSQYNSDISTEKSHSATTALWKSAVIPGWGQVYNRQAWKIGIIYGGAAAITYIGMDNYRNAQKFKTEYLNRNNGNTSELFPEYAKYPDQNIYNLYQTYEKNFQLSIIAGVALYALNLIDAYCYGHLFDFQINDDLSLLLTPSVEPTYTGIASGLTLQFKF